MDKLIITSKKHGEAPNSGAFRPRELSHYSSHTNVVPERLCDLTCRACVHPDVMMTSSAVTRWLCGSRALWYSATASRQAGRPSELVYPLWAPLWTARTRASVAMAGARRLPKTQGSPVGTCLHSDQNDSFTEPTFCLNKQRPLEVDEYTQGSYCGFEDAGLGWTMKRCTLPNLLEDIGGLESNDQPKGGRTRQVRCLQ
jgi:hypothetical protein